MRAGGYGFDTTSALVWQMGLYRGICSGQRLETMFGETGKSVRIVGVGSSTSISRDTDG